MSEASDTSLLYPIFIPSRGRWTNSRGTAAKLMACRIPFTLVVEPHEQSLYHELVKTLSAGQADCSGIAKVVALPASDQGVSYVRNYILNHLAPASDWFWIMDDDIEGFFQAVDGVNRPLDAREMHQEVVRRMRNHDGVSIFSLDYPFYAWQYGDDAVAINSYNNIAVLMNKARLPEGISYRFRIREDYDFTLQAILAGKLTVRFRNLSYKVPRMAVAAGGMTDYYEKQKADIKEQNKLFLATWPSVSREVTKGTGDQERLDISVRWLLLHPLRSADPAAILRSTTPLNVGRPASSSSSTRAATTRDKSNNGKRVAAVRKRRRADSESTDATSEDDEATSTDDDDDESSSEAGDAPAPKRVARAARPPKAKKPRPPQPLKEKCLPGWRGYAMQNYRCLTPEAALSIGLERIPDRDVKVGSMVLVVPYSLDLPAVVHALVLEISKRPAPRPWEWTVVFQGLRGVPMQSVGDCYRPVDAAASVADLITKVDAFLLDEAQQSAAEEQEGQAQPPCEEAAAA